MQSVLFWHRRDLRISDNAGLYHALRSGKVQPLFIFDHTILDKLPADDQRVLFIYRQVDVLKRAYQALGSDLVVLYGQPEMLIPDYCRQQGISLVIANRDYEPAARERDKQVYEHLQKLQIDFKAFKDQVIFERNEILKADGTPYTVFTPYSKRWKAALTDFFVKAYSVERYTDQLLQMNPSDLPSLPDMGFSETQHVPFPPMVIDKELIRQYDQTRDIPSVSGTSRLSVHLRFGTISIRELVRTALDSNPKYLDELIWRDFYQMILYHFPHSATASFRKAYDHIRWENNEAHFRAWCEGKTGYPLVDAGMRELLATGFMHNRIRMVVASFLTKHLLIDWRWGEAWFAEKLLDYEQASNVGGWQWAAGSGCDAAPYFRVFNPASQQQKFDPDFAYIRRWVPEFGTEAYPEPIVDHAEARERALKRYREGLV